MEKDLKELKAEFEEGKIQAYPNFESKEPLYSPRIGLHWILLEYSLRNKMEWNALLGAGEENATIMKRITPATKVHFWY